MKHLRLVGGPDIHTVRLIDPDTGADVPGLMRITLDIDAANEERLIRAEVGLIVDVELDLDLSSMTLGEIINRREFLVR